MESVLMRHSRKQDSGNTKWRSLIVNPHSIQKDLQLNNQAFRPSRLDGFQMFLSNAGHALEQEKRVAYDFAQRKDTFGIDECWPSSGVSMVKGLGSLGASHDASCMEQLLVHCATALENNDVTWAQQMMWVLNNIASADGGPNQRVTACFLRALLSRATRMAPALAPSLNSKGISNKVLSAVELADFVDLTPWHRFGFCAANGAILEAFENKSKVHVLDFSITHCMQWPTLIESLSKRAEGPPSFRLTVHGPRPRVPPLVNMSYEEIGRKLANFARTKHVPFEFRVIPQEVEQLNRAAFDLREDEALAVNCQLSLHYIPEETADTNSCLRDEFLRMIRNLYPNIVTFVEEDSSLTSTSLVTRLKAAFNYLWIPFDALDTFLPKDSNQRILCESDIANKIENIIACEGHRRIERLESREKWMYRMKKAQFDSVPFSEDVISEVKCMLDHHAAGWGLKREEDALLLTWKGHNAVFASAWVLLLLLPTTT